MSTYTRTEIVDLHPIEPGWTAREAYIEADGTARLETHPVVGWAVTEEHEYDPRGMNPTRPTGVRGVSPAVWDDGYGCLLTIETLREEDHDGWAVIVTPGSQPDDDKIIECARRRRAEREARA